MSKIHLAGQFLAKAKQMGDAPLFFDKIEGQWQAVSYKEAAGRVGVITFEPKVGRCVSGPAGRALDDGSPGGGNRVYHPRKAFIRPHSSL